MTKINSDKLRSTLLHPSSSSPSDEPDTDTCLSHLVQNYLEPTTDSTPESTYSDSNPPTLPSPTADPFQTLLLSHVTKAKHIFFLFKFNTSIFNRNLTSYLRHIGYNAAVCTTANHIFTDVISPTNRRYIVDGEFAGEFEMARESERYSLLRRSLPGILVARCDDVAKIVRLMCEEGRRSVKINALSLPPWRKSGYVMGKWLGAYSRSVSGSPAVVLKEVGGGRVECTAVGFDVGGEDGGRPGVVGLSA